MDSSGIELSPLPGGELDDPAAWGAGPCTAQAAADGALGSLTLTLTLALTLTLTLTQVHLPSPS